MKRVVIVDTSTFMHSSWHGYPPMIGADGLCHRVAYGTLGKLQKLAVAFQWDVLVNIADPEGGSLFRKSIYPGYKANRPPTDPDFTRQKLETQKVLADLGLNLVKMDGEESDDLIGSIARKEAEAGNLVLIVSADKDLMQLVNDPHENEERSERIGLLRPVKDADNRQAFEYINRNEVKKRTGVWPEQIPDYLALMGDVSDNIIGVEKCGKSTAAKWLNEHGDLLTLMTKAESIKGVLGQNLRNAVSHLPTAKILTTIRTDLDVSRFDYSSCGVDYETAEKVLSRLGIPTAQGLFVEAEVFDEKVFRTERQGFSP